MNTLDKTQLRELIIKGQKIQAIKLVGQQLDRDLREATEYVDEFCRQERIGGNKYTISNEAAPEFPVHKMGA